MKRFIFLSFLLFSGICLYAQTSKTNLAELPPYKITDAAGRLIDIAELAKNKVVFINFWYIPCGPCFTEMNLLEKLYLKYEHDTGFVFISITASNQKAVANLLTKSDNDSSMHPFFKMTAQMDTIIFPIYYVQTCMDIVTKDGTGMYDFHISEPKRINCPYDVFKFKGYPTSLIIDKNRKVIFQQTGTLVSKDDKIYKQVCKLIDKSLKAL